MPIWIKSENELILADRFKIEGTGDNHILYIEQSNNMEFYFALRNLTEWQVKNLMNQITEAIVNGEKCFEIPKSFLNK